MRGQIGQIKEGAERVRDIVRDLRALTTRASVQTGPVDVHHALDLAAATTQHEMRLRAATWSSR